jgi:eukaryotic-like serine/threonine-protein kinase
MDFEVGHLVGGKYRIVRRIGVGGMGSVYEARHAGLGTPVAIKVLLSQLAKVPTVADRFRREAQVSATLKHPHVIQVTDVDQLPDGRPYLVMELLKGQTLQEHMEQNKSLSREEAVDIGLQILLGLECAHGLGVVHRDLKPGNVFLDEQGVGRVAKLLDFGIAKVRASPEFQALTRPGMVMGTPEYMAPEQAFSSDQADARSDIYSVGVMLYEMLSGKLPATGSLPLAVAHQIVTHKVRPLSELCPGLPQGLLNLVHRAMQPERSARFETALDMRRALSAFAGQLSLAGRVAATASLDDRPPQMSLAPAGTQKVPIAPQSPLARPAPLAGTAEMSQFRGSPAVAPLGVPVAAAPAPSPAEARTRPGKLVPQKPISRTAEMPQQPGRALTPTLSTPDLPPPLDAPVRKRRGRAVLVGLMIVGALAGAAVGTVWFLSSRGLIELRTDPGPPPPRPMPQPGSKFAPVPQSAPKP